MVVDEVTERTHFNATRLTRELVCSSAIFPERKRQDAKDDVIKPQVKHSDCSTTSFPGFSLRTLEKRLMIVRGKVKYPRTPGKEVDCSKQSEV